MAVARHWRPNNDHLFVPEIDSRASVESGKLTRGSRTSGWLWTSIILLENPAHRIVSLSDGEEGNLEIGTQNDWLGSQPREYLIRFHLERRVVLVHGLISISV